jgi:hypothetical protein
VVWTNNFMEMPWRGCTAIGINFPEAPVAVSRLAAGLAVVSDLHPNP